MPRIIGIDEAGLGPSLGPLVVAATVWDVPASLLQTPTGEWDLYQWLAAAVCSTPGTPDRVCLTDSKKLHQSASGIGRLERSAVPLLAACLTPGQSPAATTLGPVLAQLVPEDWLAEGASPWHDCVQAVQLPRGNALATLAPQCGRLHAVLQETGIVLRGIAVLAVEARAFNRRLSTGLNKSSLLSRASMQLLSRLWNVDGEIPQMVCCDRHGGRMRYADVLSWLPGDDLSLCQLETPETSRYRRGGTTIEFSTRAERFLPVAAASIIAKYVRESWMEGFNDFWRNHVRDLVGTKGYPVDAKRFREDVAVARQRLGIADDDFWRQV